MRLASDATRILRLGGCALAIGLLAACGGEPTWPGPPNYQPDVAYCYVTLADVDCFANPQPGQAYRLVGHAAIAPH